MDLVDQVEKTYAHPPPQEPRLLTERSIFTLLQYSHQKDMHSSTYLLADKYLRSMGFVTQHTSTAFKITKWGTITHITVRTLVYLWHAFGSTCPEICADAEEIAKIAYEVKVGERVTFEATYGKERPIVTNMCGEHSIFMYMLQTHGQAYLSA